MSYRNQPIVRPVTSVKPWPKPVRPALLAAVLMLIVAVAWPAMAASPTAVQSTITLSANPAFAAPVSPGQQIVYTVTFKNTSTAGEVFAAGGTLSVVFPTQMTFVSATAGYSLNNNIVSWDTTQLNPNAEMVVTVTAQLPASGVVSRDRLALSSTTNVNIQGTADWHNNSASNGHNVVGPTITKTVDSLVEINNSGSQAVAGELVTVTAQYTFPQGTVAYNFSPRLNMEDGLWPHSSTPTWATMNRASLATLQTIDPLATMAGALVVFPGQNVTNTETGAQVVTVSVTAYRTHNRYVAATVVAHGTNLKSYAGSRWCETPGCTISNSSPYSGWNNDTTAQVMAITPDLNAAVDPHVYLDNSPNGQGGGRVEVPVRLSSLTGTPARPQSFDVVITMPLPTGWTFESSADGAVLSGSNVVWTVPAGPAGTNTQTVKAVLRLPDPIQLGATYNLTANVTFTTSPGANTHEGSFTKTVTQRTVTPPLQSGAAKSSISSATITMGDIVRYTYQVSLSSNTTMVGGRVEDTLPLGFHYVPDSLVLTNAELANFTIVEGPATTSRYHERVRLDFNQKTTGATTEVITFYYDAVNTGLDYRGIPVFDSATQLGQSNATIIGTTTGAIFSWTPPSGTYNAAARVNSGAVGVIQPLMNNAQFRTYRNSPTPLEIGVTGSTIATLNLDFRNSGAAPGIDANELRVCDTLPQGFKYLSTQNCTAWGGAPGGPCSTKTDPVAESTGTVCWTFPSLPRTDATGKFYTLSYLVETTGLVRPGPQANLISVETYSSKPGSVAGERIYNVIPAALPAPVACTGSCLTVLGLEGLHTPNQASAAPGDQVTYTIGYRDTSPTYNYTGLVIEYVYDPLLTFVSASPGYTHNLAARKLTWTPGSVPSDGSLTELDVTFQVPGVVDDVFEVSNTMYWASNTTQKLSITRKTALQVGSVSVRLAAPDSVSAGQSTYVDVFYKNEGSSEPTVTLTLDYSEYLNFVNASLTPDPAGNNIFVFSVPNDAVERSIRINFTVSAPLPYTLTGFPVSLDMDIPGAPPLSDSDVITVDRPEIAITIDGPTVAPYPGNPMAYTISLKNNGSYGATSLVIKDIFDASTSFLASPGWTLSGDGKSATYTLASLPAGETAALQPLNVQVNGAKALAAYRNQVELTTYQTSLQTADLYTPGHGVSLSFATDKPFAFPGRALEYTVSYTNNGGQIFNATIQLTLPSGFTYQSHTVNGAGCPGSWNFTQATTTWTCPSLDAGASGSVKISGMVNASVPEETYLNLTAQTTGQGAVATWTTTSPYQTYVGRPRLNVNAAVSPATTVNPGATLTYTYSYQNTGTYSASAVQLKNTLPADVTFVSCTGSCTNSSGQLTWNLGSVAKGASGTVTVTVTVNGNTGGKTIVNGTFSIQSTELSTSETTKGAPVSTLVLSQGSKVYLPQLVRSP